MINLTLTYIYFHYIYILHKKKDRYMNKKIIK